MAGITVGSRVRRGPGWPAVRTDDMKDGKPGEGTVLKTGLDRTGLSTGHGSSCIVKWDNGNQRFWPVARLQLSEADAAQETEHEIAEKAGVGKDIGKLLGNTETSDFTVVCGGEEMACHRAILWARSDAFRGGVVSVMAEGTGARWTVQGAEPAAVRDMLVYIYTGEVPAEGLKERAGGLLDLATQYLLPELAAVCRKSIMDSIGVDNAVRTLVMMDRYGDMEDKTKVMAFIIKKEAKEVMKSKDLKEFVKNEPDLVIEMMKAIVE